MNLEEYTDEELLALIESGEVEIDILLDRYRNFVKAKARRYFLVGSDMDDLIQEGMLGLYKAARDYKKDKNASFKSFASLCIDRQLITAIKKANRDKHKALNDAVSIFTEIVTEDGEEVTIDVNHPELTTLGPEEEVILQEDKNDLLNKIKEVVSKFETKVLEKFLDGFSYEEIARDLNRKEKSIDNALQRIKTKIRKINNKKAD